MELVVDANVLLAACLKNAVTRELLMDSRLRLSAPEHLISETGRHLQVSASLRNRIQLSAGELNDLFHLLTQEIEMVPARDYASGMREALKIAPHKEDAPYLALALARNIPLWSNDGGIRTQFKVKVYTTKALVDTLGMR